MIHTAPPSSTADGTTASPCAFKIIFAVPTPFERSNSLNFCRSALKDHLEVLSAAGATSILANGTTGEFPSLTLAERMSVLECCRTHFRGEVFNNIGSCCIADSLDLLAHAHQVADALVMLPPFYFAPVTSDGLRNFLYAVLSKSAIPSYLYNFPKFTQLNIDPQSLRTLAQGISSIKGIKDSDSNIESSIALKAHNPDLEVLSGNDDRLVEVYTANLNGIVAGGFSAFPELLYSVRKAISSGHTKQACDLQRLIEPWKQFRKRMSLSSIAAAKLGISTRIANYPIHVRPPLMTASQDLHSEASAVIRRIFDDLQQILTS
jgi:4-hydroxy-tetrahydrodipicolinate synthase